MVTKTSFFGKLVLGLCLCLGLAGGLLAQSVDVTITGTLGPYISGSGFISDGGIYQSGITATGTKSTQYCVITYAGTNGGSGGTAHVYLGTNFGTNQPIIGPQTIGKGSALVTYGSGYDYFNPPTTATVSNGPGTTCTGNAVVSGVGIDDPDGLIGTEFTANATLDAVGVTYSPSTENYSVPLTLSAGTFNFNCTAAATVSVSASTDSLSSNCTFKAGNTQFVTTGAFPGGTIPAPIPLAFPQANIISSKSQGTYTPGAGQTFDGDSTTLGVTNGEVVAVCSGCPTETLSPTTLPFTVASGSGPSATQPVTVTTGGIVEAYAVTTSASWITVNNASTTGGSTGGSFNVGVNPTGLAPGNYNGTVNV
ncbi:MAG TPA: hypothetical protein VN924_18685, partial [Bryobacteraceae bacterium]|nr:hypothetical protein [Bryobacteraceae bacterium]